MSSLVLVIVCGAFVLGGLLSTGYAADCASRFVEQERECVCTSDDHLPFSGQAVCDLNGNSSELHYITQKLATSRRYLPDLVHFLNATTNNSSTPPLIRMKFPSQVQSWANTIVLP